MNKESIETRCFMIQVYGTMNFLLILMIHCIVIESILFRYRLLIVQDTWVSVYSQSLSTIQIHPIIILVHHPVYILIFSNLVLLL